jgi:hypothetical protein
VERVIEVEMRQGLVALVDVADYSLVLAAGPWRAVRSHRTSYAQHSVRLPDGRRTGRYMHTLLTGWPLVDHKNGDGLDNRRDNLRPATAEQNNQNKRLYRNNRVGLKGVSRDRCGWRARITVAGSTRNLGMFDSPEKAALAYDLAAIEHFGPFARLNYPAGAA